MQLQAADRLTDSLTDSYTTSDEASHDIIYTRESSYYRAVSTDCDELGGSCMTSIDRL